MIILNPGISEGVPPTDLLSARLGKIASPAVWFEIRDPSYLLRYAQQQDFVEANIGTVNVGSALGPEVDHHLQISGQLFTMTLERQVVGDVTYYIGDGIHNGQVAIFWAKA